MSNLPTLIADLALILLCAGVMTLLFKKLKQPLVLGYVVAGFLASPHMPYTPSVMDSAVPPTFTIFLKLNSSPNANRRKITPISAQVLILAESITEGV